MALDHLGIDELNALFPGDRHAVIAILDEIDVANLIQLDRRKPDVVQVCAVDILPAAGGMRLAQIIQEVRLFLMPPMIAAANGQKFEQTWPTGGPWVSKG